MTIRILGSEPRPGRAPRRKVIDGARMDASDLMVDITQSTLQDIRGMAFHVAEVESEMAARVGNDAERVLIDGSPSKGIDKMLRTLEVYYEGGLDARPSMGKVSSIVEAKTGYPHWHWLRNGRSVSVSQPVILRGGERLVLVPGGGDANDLSMSNIEAKLLGSGAFLRKAAMSARAAVRPLFYVKMGWSHYGKPDAGRASAGGFNSIRGGPPRSGNYIQGRPVFVMSVGTGGRSRTIRRGF